MVIIDRGDIKMKSQFEWLSEAEHKRLMKIFNILKKNTTQTQYFKAPVILYMNFEKIAKQISKEIK